MIRLRGWRPERAHSKSAEKPPRPNRDDERHGQSHGTVGKRNLLPGAQAIFSRRTRRGQQRQFDGLSGLARSRSWQCSRRRGAAGHTGDPRGPRLRVDAHDVQRRRNMGLPASPASRANCAPSAGARNFCSSAPASTAKRPSTGCSRAPATRKSSIATWTLVMCRSSTRSATSPIPWAWAGGCSGSLKTLARGEIREFSDVFNHTRHAALDRVVGAARQDKANAVVGIRTTIPALGRHALK